MSDLCLGSEHFHLHRVEDKHEEILVGDGQFQQEADQLFQLNDHILYMGEAGGANPGVYGLDLETGYYFAVFEALSEVFTNDDVTGLALPPDHTRLYACIQTDGIMFEIKRDDGLPFEHILTNGLKFMDA
jgi:hypothetical protein